MQFTVFQSPPLRLPVLCFLLQPFLVVSFSLAGIYDLVNNLGSMVPRMLFSPIEESCHLLFSQCVQREAPANHQNEVRDFPISKIKTPFDLSPGQLRLTFRRGYVLPLWAEVTASVGGSLAPFLDSQKGFGLLLQALSMLRTSLRLTSLLAWIGFVFSHAYSRLLLFLYGGSSLVSQPTATELLRLFSFYIIFLAWNGPTEAFLNAAMNTDQLNVHNRRLTVFSVIFLTSTWLLVPHFGASGFILANCINMLARVAYR
ncbi:unnamed protein product [Dibothriocephalus latus]|uniref:Protein RFT1 homolog n=1 Tax=Dibothriocephalus latus TaxID=60516 RepID=A0A3P7LR54_DIBLA|nr:unnamed protein product [Dibothriocephalus latus]